MSYCPFNQTFLSATNGLRRWARIKRKVAVMIRRLQATRLQSTASGINQVRAAQPYPRG